MRQRLIEGRIVRIDKGSGGRSLGFRLYFADGTSGYYKPEQSFSGANWYAEVAAYHLDRVLNLQRVPPVVSRRLQWQRLRAAAHDDFRLSEVEVQDDGTVRGALVYWLSGRLRPAETPAGFENWLRISPFNAWTVSPYQRPAAYRRALRDNRYRIQKRLPPALHFEDPPEPKDPELAAALSDMLIFDFLTLNIDRWGGNNGNVLTLGRDRRLIFLDNGAGFSPGPPTRGLMDDRLSLLQRFRRSTVEALKALSLSEFGRRLNGEALSPILTRELLEGLATRRRRVLEHVAAMRRLYGEEVYRW